MVWTWKDLGQGTLGWTVRGQYLDRPGSGDVESIPFALSSQDSSEARFTDGEVIVWKVIPTSAECDRLVARIDWLRCRLASAGVAERQRTWQVVGPSHGLLQNLEVWVARPWVDGVPLSRMMRARAWAENEIASVAMGIVQALAFLHRLEISHGMLHEDNIIVSKDGVVSLVDFGMASELLSIVRSRKDIASYRWRKDGLMSPDKEDSRRGDPFQEDIWCLGVIVGKVSGTSTGDGVFPRGCEFRKDVSLRIIDFLIKCCDPRPGRRPCADVLSSDSLFDGVRPLKDLQGFCELYESASEGQTDETSNLPSFPPTSRLDVLCRSEFALDLPILTQIDLDVDRVASMILNPDFNNSSACNRNYSIEHTRHTTRMHGIREPR